MKLLLTKNLAGEFYIRLLSENEVEDWEGTFSFDPNSFLSGIKWGPYSSIEQARAALNNKEKELAEEILEIRTVKTTIGDTTL